MNNHRIVFNFRCENNLLPDENTIILCVNQLWENMTKDGVTALFKIRKFIRPMGQLQSGLFLNLDEADLQNADDWLKLFNVKLNTNISNKYEFVKLADNYVRIRFLVKGNLTINFASSLLIFKTQASSELQQTELHMRIED